MNNVGNKIHNLRNTIVKWSWLIILQKFPNNNWYFRFYKERWDNVYRFISDNNWNLDCLITDRNLKRIWYKRLDYNKKYYRYWVKADDNHIYIRHKSDSKTCYKYTYDFINTGESEDVELYWVFPAQSEYNHLQIFRFSEQNNQVGIYLADKKARVASDMTIQNI